MDYYKSNSENQFKDIQLQLHATDPDPEPQPPEPDVPEDIHTKVSNPYTFNIQGNKSFRGVCEPDKISYVIAYGSKPWYNSTRWSDVSKVSDLTTIDGGVKFSAKDVTNTSCMFSACRMLRSLDLSNFDTSKVTDMNDMFAGAEVLKSIDFSNFDTGNVTNMYAMFYKCNRIQSLDLSNFDTSKVTNMNSMFAYCLSLLSLDLSNFDTSKVTNMNDMFVNCRNLQTLHYSLAGFINNGMAPDLSSRSTLANLYLYNTSPSYVDLFITEASVPSTCKVTVVS